MAKGNITIEFKAKGEKALQVAILNLDVATKRLNNQTSIYDKNLKNLGFTQKQANKFLAQQNKLSLFGIKNNRLLANSFATIRSKLLLYSFGMGLATVAFKKLTDAAVEQERVEKKLEHQLGRSSKSLLNYASGLQAVTKFGDEAIINVQGMLAAFTKDEEQIKLATQATLDLAEAKGMDLKTAGDLVSKTLGSSTNALSRYGVEVTGSANSILRLESLTKNISTIFAGEATAAANTFGGEIAQMTNSMGDAGEAMGNYFQPILRRVVGFLKDAADSTKEFFNRLNESELETIVRRFEEMGVSAEEIAGIKNFMLADELDKINEKLKTTGTNYTKVSEVREAIAAQDLSTPAEVISKQIDKQTKQQLYYNSLLDAQKRIEEGTAKIGIFRGQKSVQLLNEQGEETKKIALSTLEAHLLTFKGITSRENQNRVMEDTVQKSKQLVDNAIQDGESLAVILQLLLQRDKIQNQINNTGQDDPIFKLTLEDIQSYTEQYSGAIMNVANAYNAQRQAALDSAKASELANANSIKSERRRQKEIDKINEKYAAKQKKLNKEAQRTKRAQTVINTAVSLMEIWADDTLKFPGKVVMSAFVSALGAMQLKTIDAQKYATGGLVGGRRHSQGGTMIEAERGEYVISRRGVDAIGIEALNRINAGGGGGSVNVTFAGNVLSKDFIEDEAIPQIKEAIRRGADIGVG